MAKPSVVVGCNRTDNLRYSRDLEMLVNFNTDGLVGTIDIGPPLHARDWRPCTVAVRADGFSAEYECSAREGEFEGFLSKLEAALAQLGQPARLSFRLLEHGIEFELDLDRRGHVDGKYTFGRDWRGPFLSGSFTADQTHLRSWAKELKAALAQ